VYIQVKPGTEEEFRAATLANARASAREAGVVRFDVLQDADDATQFVLIEIYQDAVEAPAAHQATAHYATWRDTVAHMMATPRTYRRFINIFPVTAAGWEYPQPITNSTLEGTPATEE
jgi:(4S)-4-hydroxy-5-phosphonooxypentane-2,3-dione isomerase